MKKKGRFLSFLLLMAIPIYNSNGQEPNYASNVNKHLSLDGKQLVINYDLISPDSTQLFDIILELYYDDKLLMPQDNNLTGSWGSKVPPGNEKVILWDFSNEFKGVINNVMVKVIARKRSDPLADFEYKILGSSAPFDVQFANKSSNADLFSWKFGDPKSLENNLSSLESPVHSFRSVGKYNVELTAGNSKNKTSDTIMKVVAIGKGNEQIVKKHKKLRTIWLGTAVVTAGIGTYGLIEHNNVYNEWKEEGTDELKKKSKTFRIIGPAALVVSGVCISQVIIQSKKIRAGDQIMSINIIPLDQGALVGLAWSF